MKASATPPERLRERVLELLDESRDAPRGLRKTQSGLAAALGLEKAAISGILKGKADFRLKHLDRIADYFGVTPATMLRLPTSALWELTPAETRIVRHWRSWAPDVQERIMPLLDYFAGMLPEEKEQRRWWQKLQRLRNPQDRLFVERTLDDVLRAQNIERAAGSGPAAPPSAAATAPPIGVRRSGQR